MTTNNARGLACPAPVLQTKAALQEESPNGVKVVVDNAPPQQNVQRFLESQGFQTVLEQVDSNYVVIGNCDSMSSAQPQPAAETHGDAKKIMVMCASDRLGFGDDTLGLKLMANFLRTLKEMGHSFA
jgi:TusA-related sulfurtransferase